MEEVHGGIEVSFTEDLMSKLDNINSNPKTKEKLEEMMILASDAVALFPSLKKEETSSVVFEEVMRSRGGGPELKGGSQIHQDQRRVDHLMPDNFKNWAAIFHTAAKIVFTFVDIAKHLLVSAKKRNMIQKVHCKLSNVCIIKFFQCLFKIWCN